MNSIGRFFKVSIFGESHGNCVGVLLDGVPCGIKLCEADFIEDLNKRKPGAKGTTTRIETDNVLIESGVFNGYTTGMPILLRFLNQNTKSKDYSMFLDMPRPSHVDFAAINKYKGYFDYRGGGHFSGRLTAAIVAAGVVAKKIVSANIKSKITNLRGKTDESEFEQVVLDAANSGDSVGGIIELTISDYPKFIGEPYFDSVESVLSHLLFSVGGVKGVSFGVGFEGANMMGSQFNDCYMDDTGKTKTNNNGGINGGIANGNDIVINVFVKPTPSIYKKQNTYNFKDCKMDDLQIEGRHDSAIILRAKVVLEAMCAIGLADLYLINKALS